MVGKPLPKVSGSGAPGQPCPGQAIHPPLRPHMREQNYIPRKCRIPGTSMSPVEPSKGPLMLPSVFSCRIRPAGCKSFGQSKL